MLVIIVLIVMIIIVTVIIVIVFISIAVAILARILSIQAFIALNNYVDFLYYPSYLHFLAPGA